MNKTVAELFAGVGGFRVGLNNVVDFDADTGLANENGDWDFVWANQWEPSTRIQHAYDCYTTRFGADHTSNTDIGSFPKEQIPDHNLLVGGFPCQDYSVARSKSTEQGIEGKKGVLFWSIVETLRVKNTPFFLLENVDRLLKSPAIQRGRDFGIMLRTLSDLGYNIEWRVINAAEYGRSQRRRRVFIFGWKRELNFNSRLDGISSLDFLQTSSLFGTTLPITDTIDMHKTIDINSMKDTVEMTDDFTFLFQNTGVMVDGIVDTFKSTPIIETPITLGEIIEDNKDMAEFLIPEDRVEKFRNLRGGKRVPRIKPNGDPYFYTEGSMSPYDSLDLPGRTMLTSERSTNRSTHIILDPTYDQLRFISPIEAERLQDFPDDWTNTGMTPGKRYFMMGNALVTGIVNRLEEELNQIFDNEDDN